ncbi:NifU family protein [Parasulfuritortus cantonensis]|uniref:NifU family protein n=1 Tax=Parasulfuritortus cantonensis TaxID=2528202 RepID=A0A4R1BCW6_9PROT|nr:NifU family protein [Parasulfuritortus cantonensis]TCJ14915.1 NifU family protein [Parasulfuritortus cantonensis]
MSDATVTELDPAERLRLIRETVEAARPGIQRDGGDLELVDVQGDRVFLRLSGKCTTCSLAGQTLGGVRRLLMAKLNEPVRVVPAPLD